MSLEGCHTGEEEMQMCNKQCKGSQPNSSLCRTTFSALKNTTSSSASASDNTLDNKPKGGNYRRRNTASCGLNVLSQARGVKVKL